MTPCGMVLEVHVHDLLVVGVAPETQEPSGPAGTASPGLLRGREIARYRGDRGQEVVHAPANARAAPAPWRA